MNKKLIIGAVVLILVSAGALLILSKKGTAPTAPATNTQSSDVSNTGQNKSNGQEQSAQKSPTSASSDEKITITVLASTFAEAYGSYSNQAPTYHVSTLYPFMTDSMKTWAAGQEGEFKKALGGGAVYHGITTKVVGNSNYNMSTPTTATITFKTLRAESIATMSNTKNYYQDITINLEKVGTAWKVAGAFWGPTPTGK